MENNRGGIKGLKLNTITAQKYVHEHISQPELYRQTAEAAADLAQACLKYARALEETDSNESYLRFQMVIDVYAELMNTAEITDIPQDIEAKAVKAQKWADELTPCQEEKQAVTLTEAMRKKQKLDEETEDLLRPFFPELESEMNTNSSSGNPGIRVRSFFPEEESEGANND